WSTNAFDVLRYWVSVQKNRGGKVADPSAPITAIMGEEMHRQFKTLCDARNYTVNEVKEAYNMGMPRTFYFEDTWVTFDSDVRHDTAYMVQPDMMEFYTGPRHKNIWKMDGPFEFKPELRNLYLC